MRGPDQRSMVTEGKDEIAWERMRTVVDLGLTCGTLM